MKTEQNNYSDQKQVSKKPVSEFIELYPNLAIKKVSENGYEYSVITKQKILIVDKDIIEKLDKKEALLTFKNTNNKDVKVRIIRISECTNDPEEYNKETYSVLVEWDETVTILPGGTAGVQNQVDNHLIINPESNNKPSPPIARPSKIVKVYVSDFEVFDQTDASHYKTNNQTLPGNKKELYQDLPIVAVMDTGLKYKWTGKNNKIERNLSPVSGASLVDFKIAHANANGCIPSSSFGYCGITEYLKNANQKPLLAKLNGLAEQDILLSPYDDNLVDEKLNEGEGANNIGVGRHGTIITAILNEQNCQVLPVKAFDGGGFGTLFDIICGCNYVLACKRNGTNIKVLNASFGGTLNGTGRDLLFRKLKAMSDRGIWVIAAAGNEEIDLDQAGNIRYPAQFGLPISVGGIERVITVNSAYKRKTRAGNYGSPVTVKVKSQITKGFPSTLPMATGKPLEGTSFAVPFAAAAMAKAPDTIKTKIAAIKYLKNIKIPNKVIFVDP